MPLPDRISEEHIECTVYIDQILQCAVAGARSIIDTYYYYKFHAVTLDIQIAATYREAAVAAAERQADSAGHQARARPGALQMESARDHQPRGSHLRSAI